MLYKLKLS